MIPPTPDTRRRDRVSRGVVVGSVAVIAFGVRALLLLTRPPALWPLSDNTWYDAVARSIESGHLGRLPAAGGGRVLSIRFPPAYPVVLALGRAMLFWVGSHDAHLWVGAALGALAAGAVAALAWRLGTRDGRTRAALALLAGLLFAVNPIVAGAASSLMAEALVLAVVALVLLVIDRLLTGDGGAGHAVVLGVLLAVGALTRSEAIVVLGAAVVGGWWAAGRSRGARGRLWALALAIGLVVAGTWSVVASVEAGRPVVMAPNSGSLLLGANCEQTRDADGIGYWAADCLSLPDASLSAETARRLRMQEEEILAAFVFALPPQIGAAAEAELSSVQFDAATEEIAEHPLDAIAAVPVRLLRGLGLYWSPKQDTQEYYEGRDHEWEVAGRWFMIVLVLPFALLAVFAALARRSRLHERLRTLVEVRRLVPLLALMAAWVMTIALSYGSARFRATIEPALAVFAAIGMIMLVTAVARRTSEQ